MVNAIAASYAPQPLKTAQPVIAAQPKGSSSSQGKDNTQKSKIAQQQELTPQEEKQVRELKARDREVRAHEQAHATVGGPYAGSPQYQYTTGPDGKRYAIGGEVPIDASAVPNNPDATIRKMDIVIRAALAPAEPSAQDKQVAQQAQQTRLQAQIEKRQIENQKQEEQNSGESGSSPATNTLDALINAIGQDQQDSAKNQDAAASKALFSQAVSGYTRASLLG